MVFPSTKSSCIVRILWYVVLVLLSQVPLSALGSASISFTPRLQKAYFEIQKLRLISARQLIDAERSLSPENVFISYLDNYADLHYLLISEDKGAFKRLLEKEDERLAIIGKLPDNAPFKRFFMAEVRLHWAFAKLKFGNEINGSWEIIRAYRLLEENRKKFPDFVPTLKSLGLLHVLIGSIPENYGWVTKILGLKGNIQGGIAEIRKVVKVEPMFRQEAELTDILLHAYTLKLSDAQQAKVQEWPREQPDNLLLHFFAATTLMKEGHSQEALKCLSDAPQGAAYIPFPFLEYLKGEISLQQGAYSQAMQHYRLFQRNYKGFNYIKDSYFKQCICFWLNDQDSLAKSYAAKTVTQGSTIIEADQLAQRLAGEYLAGKISNSQKLLYRARYATDGGYLAQAWELVGAAEENSFPAVQEKCELNYRKGRILHKMGKWQQARPFYEKALSMGRKTAAGIAASSALQLGYIAIEDRRLGEAKGLFREAMSFKKHEYKNSIDNKARAALTTLGD